MLKSFSCGGKVKTGLGEQRNSVSTGAVSRGNQSVPQVATWREDSGLVGSGCLSLAERRGGKL